jgi:hypothetical protein
MEFALLFSGIPKVPVRESGPFERTRFFTGIIIGGEYMNCNVCGNPLIYDRTVFHCSCGAFIHAYCWDEHVLQSHRPSFEIGSVNLDGEFEARETRVEEQISRVQVPGEQSSEQQKARLLE